MKKYGLFLAGVFTLFSVALSAQFSAGGKIGASFNTIKVDGLGNTINSLPGTETGYTYGIFGEYMINDKFAIQSELNFVKKGFTISEMTSFDLLGIDIPVGAKARTSLNYLEIPLLLKYKMGVGPIRGYVEVGPSISYATNGELETIATVLIDINVMSMPINFGSDTYNRTEINGNIGVGAEIDYGKGYFTGGVRYTPSFTNALDNTIIDTSIRNSSVKLHAGYAMRF